MADITTLRRLTMKSVLKVGKYPTLTVEHLLACDLASEIRRLYYSFGSIDFTDDVKEAAKIRVSIPKPGTSEDAWNECKRINSVEKFGAMTDEERIKYIMAKRRSLKAKAVAEGHRDRLGRWASKAQLQAVNHGRAHWEERQR